MSTEASHDFRRGFAATFASFLIWGLLPLYPGVSWQGHAFGALGGVLAAWLVAKASKPNKPAVTSGPAAGTTRPLGPPIG